MANILQAANWFEKKYRIALPPIYLNKSIDLSHYCWGGKYGCIKDFHICISAKQDRLLAFFHEATHIRLNDDAGQIIHDSREMEAVVNHLAEKDLQEFLESRGE